MRPFNFVSFHRIIALTAKISASSTTSTPVLPWANGTMTALNFSYYSHRFPPIPAHRRHGYFRLSQAASQGSTEQPGPPVGKRKGYSSPPSRLPRKTDQKKSSRARFMRMIRSENAQMIASDAHGPRNYPYPSRYITRHGFANITEHQQTTTCARTAILRVLSFTNNSRDRSLGSGET